MLGSSVACDWSRIGWYWECDLVHWQENSGHIMLAKAFSIVRTQDLLLNAFLVTSRGLR